MKIVTKLETSSPKIVEVDLISITWTCLTSENLSAIIQSKAKRLSLRTCQHWFKPAITSVCSCDEFPHYGGKLNTGIFCCKPLVFFAKFDPKCKGNFGFQRVVATFLTAFLVWGQSFVTLLLIGEKIEQFSKTCHQQMLNLTLECSSPIPHLRKLKEKTSATKAIFHEVPKKWTQSSQQHLAQHVLTVRPNKWSRILSLTRRTINLSSACTQIPFFNEGLNLEDAIKQRARQNSRQFVEKRLSRISTGELWIISASLFVCGLLFAVPRWDWPHCAQPAVTHYQGPSSHLQWTCLFMTSNQSLKLWHQWLAMGNRKQPAPKQWAFDGKRESE